MIQDPATLTLEEVTIDLSGHTASFDLVLQAGTMAILEPTRAHVALLWTIAGVLPPKDGRVLIADITVRDTLTATNAGFG